MKKESLKRWLAYSPKDPSWDFQTAQTPLDVRTQAELIVLRYRDYYAPKQSDAMLSNIAKAIRSLPIAGESK